MRKYLFILSPPYCGSTILWRLLATSPNVSKFQIEGQHLETVKNILRRAPWDIEIKIPWEIIKDKWEKEWDLNKPILLEKSPPHLIRAFEIESVFSPSYFILINRNPYAFCEGYCRRENKSIEDAAKFWVSCARYQRNNIAGLDNTLFFTYETLTDHPIDTCEQIINFIPELRDLDPNRSFTAQSIISYEERPIQNFNQVKINLLSVKEILRINAILRDNLDMLEFYGYEIMIPAKDHELKRYLSFVSLRFTRLFARINRIYKRVFVN